ncbi:MAG: hypothetical protein ACRDVN_11940 [Jiangellaceae bacterium]
MDHHQHLTSMDRQTRGINEEHPHDRAHGAGTFGVAALGACATDSTSPEQLTIEQSDAVPELTEQQTDEAAATTAAEATPEPPDESTTTLPVAMPDLVGMNLQLAQDTLQALGSYLLDQEDASGLDRLQIIDSNWQVCAQEPHQEARSCRRRWSPCRRSS